MNWEFFNLRTPQNFDDAFLNKVRNVYVDGFYNGNYQKDDTPFKSLSKRLQQSTDLAILCDNIEGDFFGYALFTIPKKLFEDKGIIWQDSICVNKALQNQGYTKQVYQLIKQKNPHVLLLGGRTQNPAIVKSFCKIGKAFPFDELYSTEKGKRLFNFLKENINEVRESIGINESTGIVTGKYGSRLGDYSNDWNGVEWQAEFLKSNSFNQEAGDAVVIVIEENYSN